MARSRISGCGCNLGRQVLHRADPRPWADAQDHPRALSRDGYREGPQGGRRAPAKTRAPLEAILAQDIRYLPAQPPYAAFRASADRTGAANRAFEILRAMLTAARQWGELAEHVPNACANIVRKPAQAGRAVDFPAPDDLRELVDRADQQPEPAELPVKAGRKPRKELAS